MFSLGGGLQLNITISSYATGRLESLLCLNFPKRKNNTKKLKTEETIMSRYFSCVNAYILFLYYFSRQMKVTIS